MEYSRRLHDDRPVGASIEAFRGARRTTADILERLTDEEWRREGIHNEFGRYNVDFWLQRASAHLQQHAEQILKARAAWMEGASREAGRSGIRR
ncbi:MAG: DinB family protein [Actinomycetota bacterium]